MGRYLLFAIIFVATFSRASAQLYPSFQVQVFDSTATGYYFMSPVKVPNPGGAYLNMLLMLDKNGHVVYYRPFPQGVTSGDFKLHSNGWMSYTLAGRIYFMDSTFAVVDTVYCQNGIFPDGHDVQILSNGHYLLLGFENLQMDLSAYHIFGQNGSPGSPNATVKCGVIQELDANKNVVFEWHSADHYAFEDVDEKQLNNPVNVDWTHFNSVAPDNDGNILVSPRHFNEVTKISRTDGAILWRLGGKANQFNFLNDPARFMAQHDARRIANGHLTLFDNGFGGSPVHPAAAKEYLLDETGLTATLAWSHVENPVSFSLALGNTQRLGNGNTLVNYGLVANDNLVFNVIDPAGSKAFELRFDDSLTSYRSFYYPSFPWHLERPKINCYESNGQYFLEAEAGHTAYLWSTGETAQTIGVSTAGTYFVFVPKGEGFVSSEPLFVTDPAALCDISSIEEPRFDGAFRVFPNPAGDFLTVRFSDENPADCILEITDLFGKIQLSKHVSASTASIELDISALPPGVLFLQVNGRTDKFIKW